MLKLALLKLLRSSTLLPPLRCPRGKGGRGHRRGQSESLASGSLSYSLVYKLCGTWVSSRESEILVFLDQFDENITRKICVNFHPDHSQTHSFLTLSPQNDFNFLQVFSSNELHPNILKVGYVSNGRYRERGRNIPCPLILVLLLLKLQCESFILLFL